MTTEHKGESELAGKIAADKVGDKKAKVTDKVATELAVDAVKQEAKLATGNESDTIDTNKWAGSDETNLIADMLDLGLEALKKAVDPKAERPLPEEKVAGLLILERNGKNRTDFVKLLKDRLGIKDIKKELPQAGGPDFTNDITALSDL